MGIVFEGRYCKYKTPKFKELVNHYNSNHKGQGLKRFEIRHRIKGDSAILTAPSADETCRANGWLRDDCFVKELV